MAVSEHTSGQGDALKAAVVALVDEIEAIPSHLNTRLGLDILVAALGLGALGDALLAVWPWGINVVLWVASLVLIVGLLARRQKFRLTGGGRWLVAPALLFAALFAGCDSPTLTFCNLLALLIVLALAANRARVGRLRVAGILEYGWNLINAGVNALFGALVLLFGEIKWGEVPLRSSRQAWALGRGLLLAIPLLCIFGALFAAADAVFAGFIGRIIPADLSALLTHLFWILFWGWLTAGFLHQLLQVKPFTFAAVPRPALLSLSITEIGIVLGLLNALFLAFVVVQFRYFFGGAALIEANVGFTYAEYARRGFFELVTVAALVLPVLLAGHWLLRGDNKDDQKIFRLLSFVLITLLFVIIVSAVQRMRLYTEAYGLTELRLYTTAFMGWLALVFVWFVLTVLRGRRAFFAFGGLVAGLLVLLVLNTLNPDDLITRTNLARANAPQPFDARYVAGLSADAVPALVQALPAMKEQDRCAVAKQILREWAPPSAYDWRTWNWSRWQAWETVVANYNYMQGLNCPQR